MMLALPLLPLPFLRISLPTTSSSSLLLSTHSVALVSTHSLFLAWRPSPPRLFSRTLFVLHLALTKSLTSLMVPLAFVLCLVCQLLLVFLFSLRHFSRAISAIPLTLVVGLRSFFFSTLLPEWPPIFVLALPSAFTILLSARPPSVHGPSFCHPPPSLLPHPLCFHLCVFVFLELRTGRLVLF